MEYFQESIVKWIQYSSLSILQNEKSGLKGPNVLRSPLFDLKMCKI